MKRVDVWALLLLLVWVVLLFPAAYGAFGLSGLIYGSTLERPEGLAWYLVLTTLVFNCVNIAAAIWLFGRARSVDWPGFLWALLGLTSGPMAVVLFFILQLNEKRDGSTRFVFHLTGIVVAFVALQMLMNAATLGSTPLSIAVLGRGSGMATLSLHQIIQMMVERVLLLVLHVGFAVWLVKRSSRYGERPVLALFAGLSLGVLGAVLLEAWRYWREMGGEVESPAIHQGETPN